MIRTTPLRRMTRHLSHLGFTDAETFISVVPSCDYLVWPPGFDPKRHYPEIT
jgi:hypothetical protein